MATRRRIGVSVATTEAARRQLMQPVPCWEKAWVATETSPAGTSLKIYKWIKTDKIPVRVFQISELVTGSEQVYQQFSDEEGEVDEPLVPLPDEPEAVDGDEEMDPDDVVVVVEPVKDSLEVDNALDDPPSKLPSPSPKLLMSLQPSSDLGGDDRGDGLDEMLTPLESNMGEKKDIELEISGLGPDGIPLESAHDLTQMDVEDVLTGGPLMDDSSDAFAGTS
ncbi:hypothetical protein K443DRAFT_86975 [Laccaria amethystina LaAM-08-1]|uniref:Uncharacterized protein n=1 Tax=Laccaria amethystina LaAM-08-1 TaxID=1095629 RepID=A0A0C9YHP4_9AGAR|nr:hypothetical protein K443DRAFT_86975 [Laccaria amethystina LaAM-08-1]